MDEQPRLHSRMLVDALLRKIQQEGGFATLVHCGNDAAGTILIECRDRGKITDILERSTDFQGQTGWRRITYSDVASAKWADDYRAARISSDADLWWIELDVAGAARFADEMIASR
jgi:hypothetical protein